MLISILVGVIGSTLIVLLATGLCIVGMLAIPGRKGRITEDFTKVWRDIDLEAVAEELSERLRKSGFSVNMPDNRTIQAKRPRREFKHRGLEVHTCESWSLSANIHLVKRILGVEVRLRLRCEEFVLHNSTELPYLKMLGAHLLSESYTPESPPVVPEHQSAWLVMSISAFLGLLLSLSLLTSYWPEGRHFEHYVLHINGWLGMWIGLIVNHSSSAAKAKPGLVRSFAYAPLLPSLALFSSAILYFHLQETYIIATVAYSLLAISPLKQSELLERLSDDGTQPKEPDEMEI